MFDGYLWIYIVETNVFIPLKTFMCITYTNISVITRGRKKFEDLITDAPADGLDLLKRLLHFNPDKRVTAEEALKHPYVERYNIDSL